MKEEVYFDHPKLFPPGNRTDRVIRLLKSLYGLKQAPKTFYEKLSAGLKQRGFTQSKHDACLFLKAGLICVICVDATIFAGPNADQISREIEELRVRKYEAQQKFQLCDKGEVGDFLGIRIAKEGNGTFQLNQTRLIDKVLKVLKAAGIEYCNRCVTPACTTPIGSDPDGPAFQEDWEYASIVGMLMYLAANTRPDIVYAVHQAARHTHAPRASHNVAIKIIVRYLKGTRTKGIYFKPDDLDRVDCYVDAEFSGLISVEDAQQPIAAKSRTGYAIMYYGVPVL
jgi:hypothetical protein